ncbi:MAG: single-stranded-DNA-specific exonuclease RecJ [Candidatus Latescibacteria bacterium]|nr:single-stranded-DNA-specific exonuclease RecJ [Candidatus Latescibacterota bacterium]
MQHAPAPSIRLREAPSADERARLARELSLPPAVAALAWQRGVRGADDWRGWLGSDPAAQHDPYLLPDMDLAVDRLRFAREHGQRVLVHGDYDVDGLTGAALLSRALRGLGFDADAFVPHRERDGYGLSARALDRAVEAGCSLVVTVDCGSSEGEIIESLAERGVDTVVTDHHLATALPEALAFVSPMRADSRYPFPALSGSALAYKLARALCEALGRPLAGDQWLDYAALGTVADVMPLTGENRLLVSAGLREMSRRLTARPGSTADRSPVWRVMARTAGLQSGELSAQDLAFRLAPRLNAPGRMGSARLSLQLLVSEDAQEAAQLAAQVEATNEERREREASITASARERALARLERARVEGEALGALALADADWHPGVLGISAARLADEFARPVLLAGVDADGSARGSGRGPEGQDLKALLDRCADALERYGGHRRAVGFTVRAGRWDAFAAALEAAAPSPAPPAPLMADLAVTAGELDRRFLDGLELLGPFGEGNPEPVLMLRDAVPLESRVLKGQHLRLELEAPGGERLRTIAFGRASDLGPRLHRGEAVDLCLRVARDTFQRRPGEHGLSLQLVELTPAGTATS